MFSGQDTIKIRTDLPLRDVLDEIEKRLDILGRVIVEDGGEFQIKGVSSDTFVDVKFTGFVEDRRTGPGYDVDLRYTMSPTTVGIILTVVLALVMLPLIVIPFLMVNSNQSKLTRQMREALEDLQDALENR